MADEKRPSPEQPMEDSSSSPQNMSGEDRSGNSADKKVGWIDSLAQRSTGLPEDRREMKPETAERSPWRYAGLGFQFAGTTLLFVWMGYQVDKRLGWTPWGLVSLGMLGVIGGLYLLIKDVMKENADGPEPPASSLPPPPSAARRQTGRGKE